MERRQVEVSIPNLEMYLIGKSLNDIKEKHVITSALSDDKKRAILNYSPESKKDDAFANTARWLIVCERDYCDLDLDHKFKYPIVLSKSMSRFYDVDDSAVDIDFYDDLSYEEKVDGSLVNLYYDSIRKTWRLSTRRNADASSTAHFGISFSELFKLTLKEQHNIEFDEFVSNLPRHFVYSFELTTPENEVIVHQNKRTMTFLNVRDMQYDTELTPEHFVRLYQGTILDKFDVPRKYSFVSLSEARVFVEQRNELEYEGLIIRDSQGRRAKLKSKRYLNANKYVTDVKSQKKLAEVIFNDVYDYPRIYKDMIEKKRQFVIAMCKRIDDLYDEKFLNKSLSSQEIAKELKDIDNLFHHWIWCKSKSSDAISTWELVKSNSDRGLKFVVKCIGHVTCNQMETT